ncbi:hypothetical protein [Halomonas sp. G11]|uniref:hypothetical protein n=1 Tax=Halomonas sp. G11 TaxID=1684425 RepID=UPI0018FE24A0|nr:hypothetical protein [Halomonas sp. G11]
MDTIYTLEARDHGMLEVMADYFEMDHDAIYREINRMFQELLKLLKSKAVNYQELRACLTPSTEKKEVIFVFDSQQIDSNWYGSEVFKKIIPLLDKRTSHSFLCGDYISHGLEQDRLYHELVSSINIRNASDYSHSTQYYFVYMNNVSDHLLKLMDEGLKGYKPYTGYVDITFSCFMKKYASVTLVDSFIKHKGVVICGHEDDRDNSENVNMPGYAFEENGYKCLSLQDSLAGVFLSYKIERPVYEGFRRDAEFSINSISKNVSAIDDFDVEIDEGKLKYLEENKYGRMKKAELLGFEREEIEAHIKGKINNNYIYNMTLLKDHGVAKFNVLLEKDVSNGIPVRLMVALEYMPTQRKLRLITMV